MLVPRPHTGAKPDNTGGDRAGSGLRAAGKVQHRGQDPVQGGRGVGRQLRAVRNTRPIGGTGMLDDACLLRSSSENEGAGAACKALDRCEQKGCWV
jgi:hypothetical protein